MEIYAVESETEVQNSREEVGSMRKSFCELTSMGSCHDNRTKEKQPECT